MKNNKNRTGEIWEVKYLKGKNFNHPINKSRKYIFKICRSWKCSKICGNHFQYKGKILYASDPLDIVGNVVYLGHFFGNNKAEYKINKL